MAKGVERRGGKWFMRAMVAGRRYTRTVPGNDTPVGLAKAIRAREAWIREIKSGYAPVDPELFGTVAQAYLNQTDLKVSTHNSYRNLLNQFWMPALARRQVHTIKPGLIRETLQTFSVSGKTKRNALIPLRKVFDLAIEEDLIDSNPVDSVRVKRHQRPAVQRFSADEKRRILSRLDGTHHLFYLIAFETGMRTGEILGLRWEDWVGETINVSRAIVRREETTLKTYAVRAVFASPALRAALSACPDRFRGGAIFRNSFDRPHLDADEFTAAWKKALAEARITHRRPYVCRHTRASDMLTAGVEPAYAARQLGHSLQMFLTVYADWVDGVRDAEQKRLLTQIGERI